MQHVELEAIYVSSTRPLRPSTTLTAWRALPRPRQPPSPPAPRTSKDHPVRNDVLRRMQLRWQRWPVAGYVRRHAPVVELHRIAVHRRVEACDDPLTDVVAQVGRGGVNRPVVPDLVRTRRGSAAACAASRWEPRSGGRGGSPGRPRRAWSPRRVGRLGGRRGRRCPCTQQSYRPFRALASRAPACRAARPPAP